MEINITISYPVFAREEEQVTFVLEEDLLKEYEEWKQELKEENYNEEDINTLCYEWLCNRAKAKSIDVKIDCNTIDRLDDCIPEIIKFEEN